MSVQEKSSASEKNAALNDAIARATEGLRAYRKPDGHFVFELEADATIPSEYILLTHYLGENANLELEAKIGRYLRRIQASHGGWPLYFDGAFDLSATVKAYFALKMIGDAPDAPHMTRARDAILAHGGAGRANVFTRVMLALFEELPWNAIPTMPVELILAPRWFPIHLSKMSYWARTVIVPLLVLQTLKPRARNKRGVHVGELFRKDARAKSRAAHQKLLWSSLFHLLDKILKSGNTLWPQTLRQRAIDRCASWVKERLNGEDGLGAIFPAMANSVMMFDVLGRTECDLDRAIARRSIDKLLVIKDEEAYCQPCVSPIWDTALVAHTLLETREAQCAQHALDALDWLKKEQVLDVKGDWAEQRPDVRPGGWAFQYANPHYPDLDDTAVVVLALDRARRELAPETDYNEAIARGREWVEGLQSENGGWGAFDADNTYYYLNNIPFADHGALLDPPTADVSARCIGMLAQLGESASSPRMGHALSYLESAQEKDGSWFGRWGVNYIYGTWSAMVALNGAGLGMETPMVRRAAEWLLAIQNSDGGWGESCDSYKLNYKTYEHAPSTACQTAWALLALMAAGSAYHPAVTRGIAYLQQTQAPDGLWEQPYYAGGGFPRVFYLRYHGYAKFFPLWALARYRNLTEGKANRVAYGL